MLNEQASSSLDPRTWQPTPTNPAPSDRFQPLREKVAQVMEIGEEYTLAEEGGDEITAMTPYETYRHTFAGRLLTDSETAYAQLDALLAPEELTPLFRKGDADQHSEPHEIHIVDGRITPTEGNPWVNLGLFIATAVSVLVVGAGYGIAGLEPELQQELLREITINGEVAGVLPRLSALWRGYPYAVSLLLILGAHELGHYFAARYHGHSVSLPYFIPFPLGLGTMGAVIRSREPMRNRKVLIDIGAAGPLAGMVFAVPILIIGLATSEVGLMTGEGFREGNSLLYALLKIVTLGQFYPSGAQDVFINQMAFAGWLGLFVTALNLIPVGQLDGGHVVYSLFGMKARRLYYPVVGGMIVLAFLTQLWFLWVLILMFMGRIYAPPLDDITELDPPRRGMAILTLVIFVMVFVPIPFSASTSLDGEPAPQNTVQAENQAVFTLTP